ncbi:MAG: gamma-glutamylcyclotransferase [Cyanobacteria bacterium SID2]|nr:gamma-glutamylcyclotransferase [Cyanobacteria bacterium SID2]MBP0006768.1 gamma-glutamylcyclotransferase [Cyanobacteria bacterium SBC]
MSLHRDLVVCVRLVSSFESQSMLNVFVYGTLQPGERYHDRYCGDRVVATQPAMVRGKLYHLPPVNYPAMTPGKSWVKGVILSFEDPRSIEKLDELEGFKPDRNPLENDYNRYEIEVFAPDNPTRSIGIAWAYFMNWERIQQLQGIRLSDGIWREIKKA